MPSEEQFFTKLGEIPVLNDGWTTAWDYYSRVRDYNSVTKFTLGVAESSVKKAAEISTPVVNRCQPQIDTVNAYACNKLVEIENKYPAIKMPPGEMKDACFEYVEPVVGRVKPVVTYVQGVVDNSKKRVVRIKTRSTDAVVGVRDFGVNSVGYVVNKTFDTPPGRLVTRTVDGVLTRADELVDKYIPEERQEEDDEDSLEADEAEFDSDAPDDSIRGEEMELMDPSPRRVAVHLKTVSNKLRQRMFQRAMKDFRGAKVRTMEAIGKLQSSVDLIDYAKRNMGAARDKAENMWSKIIEEPDQSVENTDSGSVFRGTLEERAVALGRTLISQVRTGVTALEKASAEAGLFLKHPISKSQEYKDFVFQFSSDITKLSVEKARSTLTRIQKRLQETLDSVGSPEWLAVNIEMENIGLEDEDLNTQNAHEDEEREVPQENHS